MPKVTPDEFAEKWQRRIKAATEDIRRGVEKVEVSPTEEAAKKKDKMLNRLTEAVREGKWENGLLAVGLDEWKNKTIRVGIGRIASGADENVGKVKDFAEQVIPHIAKGQEKLKAMPDISLEDSINRVTTWIRHMAEFRKRPKPAAKPSGEKTGGSE